MSRTETAFLPAAQEIEQTPPSPAGRAILWVIVLCFVSAVAWASLSQVDIVAVAQGRIIPSGHSKTVQPLEIGSVRAIHVTDGQAVHAGDVLIELDPTSAQADVDRLRDEVGNAQREVARFATLADWLEREGVAEHDNQRPLDPILLRQWREFGDRRQVLQRERAKLAAERDAAARQVDKLQAILPLVTRRATDQKGLAEQKLLPEQQYLETEQARLTTFHDLAAHRGEVARLAAAVDEIDARIAYAHSEFHRQALERHEAAEQRLTAAQQELIKADTRVRAQTITAPVGGVVQQLAVHNVGAIVTPAQALLVIVPQDEALEVEAVLENKDVGFVAVGQDAAIKIDAFPFTQYGTIDGQVVDLSNDAVADERKGLVYKLRVRMQRTQIDVSGRPVKLSPGMTVTVESKTGTRRMIEFFLSPLLRYRDESVRER